MPGRESPVSIPVADCSLCPFCGKTLLTGRCLPGDTCVIADSGRQIDRFFRVNPIMPNVIYRISFGNGARLPFVMRRRNRSPS